MNNDLPMMNLLKKGMQILKEELAHYEQLRVNAENEYQAMSCGLFDPLFLDKIKRTEAGNRKIKNKEK